MSSLKDKISGLPESPGVYIFKDSGGKIIYIGKAKSLKKRVSSYFSRFLSSKTQSLVSKIAGIEYKKTFSESQAQILEAALIKDNQPQYNISLKDDKSFPWIRITDEKFPMVSICRRKEKLRNDNSVYFGPYTNAALLRQAIKVMRTIFGFRSCKNIPGSACLYYRLKLCPAPCTGNISSAVYKDTINSLKLFLESRYEELIRRLSLRMEEVSKNKEYEEAAKLRDQINALSAISSSASSDSMITAMEDLKNLLKLKNLPVNIEAFDISNISGQSACGSMASFLRGAPDKNNYRRFRIKTVTGVDDYACLKEVVHRRYARVKQENLKPPNLILIDGGKAHLLTAERELEKLGMDIPLASIAKEDENIYVKGKKSPIIFSGDRPALNLIRRLRDEAHRFALSYHHVLHRKKIIGR
ncbi:excinuclease ABC subunit UvrC [bacterium]|nr:MAG: excinuclease ABC subunit UvrC [bacterium]